MINDIQRLSLKLASPEVIKSWSYGEIMKPETINYRTHNPEFDGLFCERIFGPVKDWTCSSGCGKLKRSKNKGQICDRCGVEVTKADVRRKRMGHIELGTPVVHHWFLKTKPYYISTLLDIKKQDLELVVYTEKFIVKKPGMLEFAEKQLIRRKEYDEARRKEKDIIEELKLEARKKGQEFDINSVERFQAGTGAAVIHDMLAEIDLDKMITDLTNELNTTNKIAEKQKIEKRLHAAEVFKHSDNRPEWMVLTILPVMPPDLRPMVQLDGGRFATSDINDLYRKVINRNNRYKRLIEMKAPSIIIDNEARLLQEAVDSLYNNSKTTKPQTGPNNRKLKSITDQIEKKQGIFRQNLLGKRVDYSGRSVIIAGPKLKLHQCGIPREMAIELFKPMVMRELIRKNLAKNAKNAKRKIESRHEEIWDVLEEVVKGHPVLLNRAPTLHKLSIRAFEVVLIESKAIRLHPLVCSGYNADFDGDQMAVHVPISEEAQAEARILMLANKCLLHPQNGDSAVTPSQDMILGSYYLTIELKGLEGEGRVFATEQEAIYAYERKEITLHTRIVLDVRKHSKFTNQKYLVTTVGKIIFNQIIPNNILYMNTNKIENSKTVGSFSRYAEVIEYLKNSEPNKPFAKGFIKKIIGHVYNHVENQRLADMMDDLKDIGFKYATKGGITINLFDIKTSEEKEKVLQESKDKVEENRELYIWGQITDEERYEAVCDIWNKTTEVMSKMALRELEKNPLNPIWMMMDSGARGSDAQYKQLAGIRGPMADPSGKTIEKAILSNYLEGLSPHEFFISTHGTRKGLADTAIKTASSGYLTRRMVDVAQDVYVAEDDCYGEGYMMYAAIKPEIESLNDRIVGRYLAKDLHDEKGKVLYEKNTFITNQIADNIVNKFDKVPVRTVMTCESRNGVCAKCYGMDLSTRRKVEKGEAIGIIAAQSIGEPGTQLTMRTFHTGGIATANSGGDITQGLPRIVEIFEARKMEGAKQTKAILSKVEGTVEIVEKAKLKDVFIHEPNGEVVKLDIPQSSSLIIKHGEIIKIGDQLTKGPIDPNEMLALRGMEKTKEYILEEVQKVYAKQGVKISDKHIETIVRQMTRKVLISNSGDSNDLLRGAEIDRYHLKKINEELRNEGKQEVEFVEIIKGITTASLDAESFLSRASFQETSRGLVSAAVAGEIDDIKGLKESVIIGKMIPSGTGFVDYQRLRRNVKRG